MRKIIIKTIFILLICITPQFAFAAEKIPIRYRGEWNIELVKQEGYPWWREVKYPVHLSLTETGGAIKDQYGYSCELKTIIYDPDADIIVFRYCGIKMEDVACDDLFRILQTAQEKNGKLMGEVKNYKTLFKWIGTKK